MNNERTLPKAWKKIDETSEIAIASSGVSKVIYIQDEGEKTEGNGYIDKITGKLYLCKTTNEDIEVTDNFVLATNIKNATSIESFKNQILDSKFIGNSLGWLLLRTLTYHGVFFQIWASDGSLTKTNNLTINFETLGITRNTLTANLYNGSIHYSDETSSHFYVRCDNTTKQFTIYKTDSNKTLKYANGFFYVPFIN